MHLGSQVEFSKFDVFLSLKVVFILANSADTDEMQHFAAFHMGLHCLPKYLFRTGKGIGRFAGIYAYCPNFIERMW